MKLNKLFLLLLLLSLLLSTMILAACSEPFAQPENSVSAAGAPQTATEPTATTVPVPTMAGNEWTLMTFGDSKTSGAIWPDRYAAYIEEDLGVEVKVINRAIGGQASEKLLERLQKSESERKQVREADIVTLWTVDLAGFDIIVWNNFDKECDPDSYQATLDAVVTEILEIREQQPTIVRLLELNNFAASGVNQTQNNFLAERKPCIEQYNESIHKVADKYGIAVVPVYEAFNGPDGEENPDDRGYLSDGVHLSNAGDEVVADLLRDLGYDPILP